MFDFASVKEVRLSKGAHKTPEQGMCFMEMAAWFAGEEHSDKPACVSPALGWLGISINDSMRDPERDSILKPMIPHVVGTQDDCAEVARIEYICLRAFNYAFGFLSPEFVSSQGPARHFHDARSRMEHFRYVLRSPDYSYKKGPVGDLSPAMAYGFGQPNSRFACELSDTLDRMFDLRTPYIDFAPSAKVAQSASVSFPNIENARCAGRVFALMGEAVPDWSVAVDTLREAIKLGRHDGFDVAIDLEKRHVALRELVDA